VKQSESHADNDGVRKLVSRSAAPWVILATLTAIGAAAAAGYGLTAPNRYKATALLLVSPIPASDTTFIGIDVLRDVGGKPTAAASAAAMLSSPQVVSAVEAQLGLTRSADAVVAELHPDVIGASDVVAVNAEDTSATGAAQLANAFADTLVSQRTASLQSQLATAINRDQQLLAAMSPASRAGAAGTTLQERVTALRGFQGQADPTVRVSAQASAPSAAYFPKVGRLTEIGAAAGLAVGLVAAILILLARARGRAADERPMSDRLVRRLEQQANDRIDQLLAEQKQLLTRESELAAREWEVASQLEQARTAANLEPVPVDENRERLLAEREAKVGTSEEANAKRLAQNEQAHAAREARIAEREQTLAAAPVQRAAPESPGPEVAEREQQLEARVAGLAKREAELARRAGTVTGREREAVARAEELERRTAELEEWAAELAAREETAEPEPEPVPAAEPEPEPESEPAAAAEREPAPRPLAAVPDPAPEAPAEAPPAAATADGRWNLFALERLVEARGEQFPERRDEWSSYLFFLREYAEPDGSVPASFDGLIEDTFSELVA
jgi:capsular polysaccharide biosynthesis protein